MKDNFSRQAGAYAKYRPGYPTALFDFVLAHLQTKELAWDCATGNGQTARELAGHFAKVIATDISREQLANAQQAPNIIYKVQPGEETDLDENSVDLVTISQALHWLQVDKFYTEVKRVAKPGSWIAAWMYSLPWVSPAIDDWIGRQFYKKIVGAYWDKKRKHIDAHYGSLAFPFQEIPCPVFSIRSKWTWQEMEGYINTWSAVQKFISVNGYNPVDALMKEVKPLWSSEPMDIVFPVYMRMGQIHK